MPKSLILEKEYFHTVFFCDSFDSCVVMNIVVTFDTPTIPELTTSR